MRMALLIVVVLGVTAAAVHAEEARAQTESPTAGVCIAIDDTRDTLSPQERAGAILMLARQFELAGRRVIAEGCAIVYRVSHVRLGERIFVTLSSSGESREGTALGLNDLPALYNQLVRSILTGRPMGGFAVVDRTNVTASQSSVTRVQSERFGYARLGYGTIFGDRTYGTPSLGFGYRIELDSLGLDVSFLNLQTGGSAYGASGATAGSWLKLQGLYFLRPTANASAYVGGGLSWGGTHLYSDPRNLQSDTYTSGWHGRGLQGELTAGYELPRASTLRVFFEVNGVLPFYRVRSETYSYSGRTIAAVDRRYAPSAVVSIGLGWERGRK